MNKSSVKESLLIFLAEYNLEEKAAYWHSKSAMFFDFWREKMLNDNSEITVGDINAILRIIDDKAKDHQINEESIGRVGIYQSLWHKAFFDIKHNKELQLALDKVFNANDDSELINSINDLLRFNKGRGNGLNGEGANMINSFLFLKNPDRFLSVLALKHRRWIADIFQLGDIDLYSTPGEKIVKSNYLIQNNFNDKFGCNLGPRPLSEFLYTPFGHYTTKIKHLWYKKEYVKSPKKDRVANSNDSYQAEDNYVGIEGKMIPRFHTERERDCKIIEIVKRKRLNQFGRLDCEACGFNFKDRYGERGDGVIECHHKKPISSRQGNELTKVDDIALICSNCHRMIHSKMPWLSIEELRNYIINL